MKDLKSGDEVYSIDENGQIFKDEIIMILHGALHAQSKIDIINELQLNKIRFK